LPRRSLARGDGLIDSKVLDLRAGFQPIAEPDRLRASPCPGIPFGVAIFDSDLPAFHCAAATSSSSANLAAQSCKLLLQLNRPLVEHFSDIVAQFQKLLDRH